MCNFCTTSREGSYCCCRQQCDDPSAGEVDTSGDAAYNITICEDEKSTGDHKYERVDQVVKPPLSPRSYEVPSCSCTHETTSFKSPSGVSRLGDGGRAEEEIVYEHVL